MTFGAGRRQGALDGRFVKEGICSAAVSGIEGYPVVVEVNVGYGDTVLVIVVNKTPKVLSIAPLT